MDPETLYFCFCLFDRSTGFILNNTVFIDIHVTELVVWYIIKIHLYLEFEK